MEVRLPHDEDTLMAANSQESQTGVTVVTVSVLSLVITVQLSAAENVIDQRKSLNFLQNRENFS